ncbi:hypothetical protein GQ457_18G000240 [Hibiscus cannabinus]
MCRCAVTTIEKEEMLQLLRKVDEQRDAAALHSRVRNRQSAEKTKQPRYFAAHMAPPAGIVPHVKGIFPYSVRAQNPRTLPIKGTLKELVKRELGGKEKEEKVKRGTTIVELQARVLLHLGRDSKLESTATFLGISFLLFPCIFFDGL